MKFKMIENPKRQQISDFLRFSMPESPVGFTIDEGIEERGFRRLRIHYPGLEGETIPAFLLLPEGAGPFPGVLVHHQHAGQRHFGKSEVVGLVGNPLQAFGPALARQGMVVLAPDSICFEDRRKNLKGTEPDADPEADGDQHYDELCYRLLRGDTLMRKVLSDSALAISLLLKHPLVDPQRIGMLGHSYGGNTVLFHGALDTRIQYACSSGAACSYQHKLEHQVGIEMAEVIPGFMKHFDISDLVACFAPRRLLIVSAANDAASQDADQVIADARQVDADHHIDHKRYEGGHSMTQERFDAIVQWMVQRAKTKP